MSTQYWVHYTVLGRKHRAGPYTALEANGHLKDIAGYEGITGAKVVPEDDPKSALDRLLEDE